MNKQQPHILNPILPFPSPKKEEQEQPPLMGRITKLFTDLNSLNELLRNLGHDEQLTIESYKIQ